jgi:hypothetical protein
MLIQKKIQAENGLKRFLNKKKKGRTEYSCKEYGYAYLV